MLTGLTPTDTERVVIYDLLGRCVASFAEPPTSTGGAPFDRFGLSAGVYVECGDEVRTTRLTLIR